MYSMDARTTIKVTPTVTRAKNPPSTSELSRPPKEVPELGVIVFAPSRMREADRTARRMYAGTFDRLSLVSWKMGSAREEAARRTIVRERKSILAAPQVDEPLRDGNGRPQYQEGEDDQDHQWDEVDYHCQRVGLRDIVFHLASLGKGEDRPLDHPEEVAARDHRDEYRQGGDRVSRNPRGDHHQLGQEAREGGHRHRRAAPQHEEGRRPRHS